MPAHPSLVGFTALSTLVMAASLGWTSATAAPNYVFWEPSKKKDVNVALSVSSQDAVMDYGGRAVDTRTDRVIVSWHETLSPRYHGGVTLGWTDYTEFTGPSIEGGTYSGYFLGIELRGLMIDQPRFQLGARFSGTYNDAIGLSADTVQDLSWYELELSLTAQVVLGQHVSLYAGGELGSVNGRRRAETVINFNESQVESGFAGIDLRVDRSGHLGFEVKSGRTEGGLVYFRRWF